MNNQITFKQYRNIDIGILCIVTAVFEAIATLATSRWFAGQPMAISITLALILIAMHRWGAYAAVVAAVLRGYCEKETNVTVKLRGGDLTVC
jgi:hypothetical protein